MMADRGQCRRAQLADRFRQGCIKVLNLNPEKCQNVAAGNTIGLFSAGVIPNLDSPMQERQAVVALDVGGTKTACGLFLDNGETLFEHTVATLQESAESSIRRLACLIDECLAHAPDGLAPAAAGIAVPGWVNRQHGTVWAPNVEGWDHIPLQARLSELVAVPVVVTSDRSAYVTGEAWLGAARGLEDVVFLAVGTGIGAGILAGGRLVHGHDDLAGAVGWMALDPRFAEAYAVMGCFEAEASGNSIARKAAGRMSPPTDTAAAVFRAASSGDASALELVNEIARYLGMGVANLVSTLNPQMVVLGGGLFQCAYDLIGLVRGEFVRWAQPFAAQRVRLEMTALAARAGLAGAARIAFDSLMPA